MDRTYNKKSCKRICVVIVNYRTVTLTLNCIKTLVPQLDKVKDQIVVVDNQSGSNDLALLKDFCQKNDYFSFVTIIDSGKNGGFSFGNNIGVKSVKAKYYLLANGDTLFRDESIAELLQTAKEYPQAGIISPRLEWPDGEPQISCFRYHSPLSEFINAASTGIFTQMLKKYDVPLDVVDNVTMPEWTSFACVLIRKEVFDKIGYMDEGYFMYYEDVDFCRKTTKEGFLIVNIPSARVVHLRGQSSGMKKMQRQKKRLPAYYYQSRSRYFEKFYGRFGLLMSNMCWLVGRCFSLLKEILFRRQRSVPEYQFIDIWKI